LDVGEDKKKRKGDSRISLQVKPSGSSPTAGEKVAVTEGEVKSPAKKRSKTLSRRSKRDDSLAEAHKDLVEVDTENLDSEDAPAAYKAKVETSRSGGSSPWDPLFYPEAFLSRCVDMAGSGARFDATGSEELMRMALGHELKGLLLNYALASRQRAELASAKERGEIVEKNLATLEDDVKAAKERCEGDLKSLKEKHAEEVASLKKKHEGELSDAKRDKESAIKTMNVVQASMNSKDERIKALTQENETALAELKVLREEKAKWGSEKENLEVLAGEQYDEGFSFALDQVKILFPDLDPATLSQADTMSAIESGKLIPYVPAQKAPESSAKESPENVEEPLARSSPANE
jgi:hypothetical protein